jgi:hypothetical protein
VDLELNAGSTEQKVGLLPPATKYSEDVRPGIRNKLSNATTETFVERN